MEKGKRDNLTLKTFSSLIDALGYNIVLENRSKNKGLPKRITMDNLGRRRIRKQAVTI